MTIKIKMSKRDKAVVRFDNPAEAEYYRRLILGIRDDGKDNHPKITFKGIDGYKIPPLSPPGPMPSAVQMPQNLTPEMIQKLKMQTTQMPQISKTEVVKPGVVKADAEGKPEPVKKI